MSKRSTFRVMVGGRDVSSAFAPYVVGIRVTDKAGQSSDSASIELDDREGRLVMPAPGDAVSILLGWEGAGVGEVFRGVVDDIKASGGRQGRSLFIEAKGMDTRGKAKEPRRLHLDDTTIGEAMQKAGEAAGISVQVDGELSGIAREYVALDDESFIAFGERIAREVGGTFKVVGDRAVLAKRNGGLSASGASLPTIAAAWGRNLHQYDITPIIGRPVEETTAVRWYDRKAAEWKIEEAVTGLTQAITKKTSIFPTSHDTAKDRAGSDAEESKRKSGKGTVAIEGDIAAQPEALCIVSGCRPGVDGAYRIECVDHEYSRFGGFVTFLELSQPQEGAGVDGR